MKRKSKSFKVVGRRLARCVRRAEDGRWVEEDTEEDLLLSYPFLDGVGGVLSGAGLYLRAFGSAALGAAMAPAVLPTAMVVLIGGSILAFFGLVRYVWFE